MIKKYRLIFVCLSFVFLLLFALLSRFEDRPAMRNLDFAVTVKVQEKIDRSLHLRMASLVGNVMEGATFFASPIFTSVIVLLFSVVSWKKLRWRAFGIPVAFALIVLIELFAKSIVHHPSPPFSMIKHPTSIFPANYINEQFSYPSGHAARAIFIAIIGYMITKKRWVIIGLLCYALLVSLSRIYLGEHWFSDVVGGLFLGGALGVLTWASMGTYNR